MAIEGVDLRISLQRLLTVLVLTIVPLSIVGLYITDRGDRALEQTVGSHFKMIADSKAGQISQFINDVVIAMGGLAAAPVVREEATSADQAYRAAGSLSVDSRIQSMRKEWNSGQGGTAVQKVLSTRAARLLSRYRETDARFLRITVTDEKGLVIAATHKPTMYYYAGDEQWIAVYAGGKGAVRLSDAKYDETTKTHYVNIGAPVIDEGSSRFLGAVQALVDISPIAALLNRGLTGAGPRASLVKEDGTIIFGPEVSLSMNLKAPEYPAVNDALTSAAGRETGYVVADRRSGGHDLVGLADTGLKRDYGSLGWVVLVTQDEREATAPIRVISQFAFGMVVLGLLMVLIVGVYFYLHRRQQITYGPW
jgi:Cache domain